MNWVILGGSGQLGMTLQDQLKDLNKPYLSPSRNDLDLTSEIEVARYFDFAKPSVVINCAAWTNVDEAESNEKKALAINGYAVSYIAKYAKKYDSTVVQISTDYVFSGESTTPWKEFDNTEPKTIYGRTKLFGEKVLLDLYPQKSYVVRTAWLYSKYGKNFVKNISKRVLGTSESISVVDDQIGQPTLADDLSQQIILMLSKKIAPGIYHGTNSGKVSWYDLAREVSTLLGEDAERIVKITSQEINRAALRPSYSVLGHDAWTTAEITKMRDWKLALRSSIENIVSFSSNKGG